MISVIYDEKARRMSYWPYATTLLNCAGRQVWPRSTDTADLPGAGAAACNRSDRHDQCVDTAESDDAEPRWLHSGFAAGTGVVSLTVPLIFPRIRVSRKVPPLSGRADDAADRFVAGKISIRNNGGCFDFELRFVFD